MIGSRDSRCWGIGLECLKDVSNQGGIIKRKADAMEKCRQLQGR